MNNPDLGVGLALYNNYLEGGGFIEDVTRSLEKTWKRSIRDVGGYWIGTAQWEGPSWQMLEVFQSGMMREIRESVAGITTWEGFLSEMTLTYQGQKYTRSWNDIINRVKVLYSKIGPNLVDNPSVETSNWTATPSAPTTLERSTAWKTDGDYSCHILGHYAEGVFFDTAIAVTAEVEYKASIDVNIISGWWIFKVRDTTTEATLSYTKIKTAGQMTLEISIPETHSSTEVDLLIFCATPGTSDQEIYIDNCIFRQREMIAASAWQEDKVSQAEYGIKGLILYEDILTDAAANALALRTLYDNRWAKVRPPGEVTNSAVSEADSLELTFLGYAFTLQNKYANIWGENDASVQIDSLISGSQYITKGSTKANTLHHLIETDEPRKAWEAVKSIIESGDASGNRWVGQVLADKKFYYGLADTTPIANIRSGKLIDRNGDALVGCFAMPGLIELDDMPFARDFTGSSGEDTVHTAWMNEAEWSLGNWIKGEQDTIFRRAESTMDEYSRSHQITFGGSGGGISDPTYPSGTPWWGGGGGGGSYVPPVNVVTVLQPIGAGGTVDGYTNVADPGTNDASAGTAVPSWSSSDGWTFDRASGQYLNIPGTILSGAFSIVARIDPTSTEAHLTILDGISGGAEAEGAVRVMLDEGHEVDFAVNWDTIVQSEATVWDDTVIAVTYAADGTFAVYINGVADPCYPEYYTNPYDVEVTAASNVIGWGFDGKIKAVAIYDVVLTPAQVQSVTNEMWLLSG